MKSIKNQSNRIALLMSILMFFSSCVTYKKTSLNLDELVQSQDRVRVEYNNSEIYRFRNLVSEDGNYYGMMSERLQKVKKPIEVERIKSVKVYDKSTTILASIGGPIAVAGIFCLAVLLGFTL